MELQSIEAAIALAEQRWPGLEFHRKDSHEASAPCPFCQQATTDGFLIFEDGGYWCRKCSRTGWLDEGQRNKPLTHQELTEIRLRRMERKQQEHDERLSALERIARCTDHERYHANLAGNEAAFEWFIAQGFETWAIFDYKLGACPRCPTDREGRPSYTFPIWRKDGPLWSIRHRLRDATNGSRAK